MSNQPVPPAGVGNPVGDHRICLSIGPRGSLLRQNTRLVEQPAPQHHERKYGIGPRRHVPTTQGENHVN